MDQSVKLTIDGREVTVPLGAMVLEAAKRAGIEIPSLCNQEKLLPAGLCRLCLVEIEKMRGLQAACATAVREGMIVHTDTPAVLHNRRMVLELLCTNHPLDCPVCDAAGDCKLQDYVFRYGRGDSRFVEEKRHKGKAIDLGPAVVLDQERCILCQRCVRFCEEILDDKQLAVFRRGASSRISALPGQAFDSPFSGNVIDLCPVGAMTSRVFRFKARTWELQSVPSVCGLCPMGCRLTADTREGRLLRLRGREAPEVNDGWLCDRGRTGHGFTDSADRLRRPLVRRNGNLEPATWDEALDLAAAGLKRALIAGGPQAVAALGGPRLTNEAAYLLSKLVRVGMGSNNVDGRLGTAVPAPAQATPSDLRAADVIVLFMGDPLQEAPILELWARQAARRGAALFVVHPGRLVLGRYARRAFAPRPGTEAVLLGGVLAEVGKADPERSPTAWLEALAELGPTQVASLTGCPREAVTELAAALTGAERAVLAYGAGVRDQATMAMLTALAEASGARLLGWGRGANARGVADMGLRPDRLPGHALLREAAAQARCRAVWGCEAPDEPGYDESGLWEAMQQGDVRALIVAAADVVSEAPDRTAVDAALSAGCFLVVQDSFLTRTAARANVVLPAAVWGEEHGTQTNLAGQVRRQRAAIAPLGESRPHWQILAGLARRLGAPGEWGYETAEDVLAELGRLLPAYAGAAAAPADGVYDARFAYEVATTPLVAPAPWATVGRGTLALIVGPVLFDRDVLTARAPAVAARAPAPYVAINPEDAGPLGISDGGAVEVQGEFGTLNLQARVTGDCLPGMVFVPEHLGPESTNVLGACPGVVTLVTVKPAS